MIDLKEPQGIFEDFTQFSDLRSADRAFFTRRVEVVIKTFLQVPFEQLDALFHADPLGPAPPRLMEILKLYQSTHIAF
jgi:hypothetical protein